MHYCLQNNLYDERGMVQLKELLERFNYSWSEHKVVPIAGTLEPALMLPHKNVICFGSYSMRHIAKANGWYPGVFDLEHITYADQIEHWGDAMLNHDAVTVQYKDVLPYAKELGTFFWRPTLDSKTFAGTVADYNDKFIEEWNNVVVLKEDDGSFLRGSTEIIISSPKNIVAEYRFFIINDAVITGSLYKRGGRVLYSDVVEQHIYDFAIDHVTKWHPADGYVFDVAVMRDGSKRIVEINTMNSAGFYHCDVQKIVEALDAFSK